MMDKLLLIIPDWLLRQLYHELLISKNIEIVPMDKVADAILILSLTEFRVAVFYVNSANSQEVENFLRLRKKHKKLSNVKIILLSEESFNSFSILKNDLILDVNKLNPVEIVEKLTNPYY